MFTLKFLINRTIKLKNCSGLGLICASPNHSIVLANILRAVSACFSIDSTLDLLFNTKSDKRCGVFNEPKIIVSLSACDIPETNAATSFVKASVGTVNKIEF